MWTIREHKRLDKELRKAPTHILEKYEFWKNVVRTSGPEGLRKIKSFHDEALLGKHRGHRSSRLSNMWRVMYEVDRDQVAVNVERVSFHDYN